MLSVILLNVVMLNDVMLYFILFNVVILSHFAECHYTENRYAECHYAVVILMNGIILSLFAECRYAECQKKKQFTLTVNILNVIHAEFHNIHLTLTVIMVNVVMVNVVAPLNQRRQFYSRQVIYLLFLGVANLKRYANASNNNAPNTICQKTLLEQT